MKDKVVVTFWDREGAMIGLDTAIIKRQLQL